MRQQHRRDIRVVLKQVALGNLQLRPEQLGQISKLDVAIAEANLELIDVARNPQAPLERRKRAIGWLSRSKDPEVLKFLEDLLK